MGEVFSVPQAARLLRQELPYEVTEIEASAPSQLGQELPHRSEQPDMKLRQELPHKVKQIYDNEDEDEDNDDQRPSKRPCTGKKRVLFQPLPRNLP